MKFSKAVVTAVVVLNAVATTAFLWAFVSTGGNEPTALITAWFGFTTGELWLVAGIKKSKLKKEVIPVEGYQPITPGPETSGPETGESVQG